MRTSRSQRHLDKSLSSERSEQRERARRTTKQPESVNVVAQKVDIAKHRGGHARDQSHTSSRSSGTFGTRRGPKAALFGVSIILIIALFASFLYTLSLTGPTWSPVAPYTNSTLNCSWTNSSDTIAQNITVLRNGVIFNSTFENASLVTLSTSTLVSAANTTKGDIWTCRITLNNGTATLTSEVNTSVVNSPPTTEGTGAGIFNNSADIGYLFQVNEDTSYTIDVNATDADGDTLEYLPATSFCALIDSTNGIYTCLPTNAYISSNAPTQKNITFTASDGQNVGGRTVRFNITPINDAPIATLTNKQTPVNQSLNYTFSITDEENNFPLTLQLTVPAEIQDKVSISRINVNGSQVSIYYNATSPDFADIGLWNISLNVTDNSSTLGTNDSRSVQFNYTFNISAVGRTPYFTGIVANKSNASNIYTIAQGESIQINISANDPDANSTLTFLDNTAKFNIVTVKADTNSSDAKGQINFTPTNSDVGRFNVTITIQDLESLRNTTVLQFNITNVNDPPVINELSTSSSNTQNNTNASSLSAYANTLFTYDINASDIDTQYGDVLSYSDNTTLFNINSTSGRIQFTPTNANIGGPYAINITVADSNGASASRTILLTIIGNTPPYFNATLPQLNCTTNAACSLPLNAYAADIDPGDSIVAYNVTFVSGNLSSFDYSSSGLINFTPAKTEVGNYTLNVTITDTYGATNSSTMVLRINNTPEAPILTRYDFSNQAIVENHLFTYELQATDNDFQVSSANESVTFTTNLSVNHTITPLTRSSTTARALLSFTPQIGSAGNYTIRINATDRFGFTSQQNITIEILSAVPAPSITNITPWGVANTTHDLQTTWTNTSQPQFADGVADVNLTENTTVLFNITVNDSRPLTYNWTVNGTSVAATQAFTKEFDFFSNGTYLVKVNVSNDRLESTVFQWLLTVRNLNRPPVLNSSLATPLTVNGTYIGQNYFTGASGQRYYDPDDDRDSDGHILAPENYTMTFGTNSTCSVAALTISGSDLTIVGTALGSCQVIFFATDRAGAVLGSNTVNITVTQVVQGITDSKDPTTSSGGGGGGGSTFIPISKDQEKPKAFNLVAPKLVTIYENRSIQIPIIINNTWKDKLSMVRLVAQVNATGVNTSFDTDFFESIPKNESREVMLTISNYRFGSNYEVKVLANVSDPQYSDEALILLNSIEQSQEGRDAEVKVTFANDLVNQHPECQELNEVLEQAKQEIANGRVEEGGNLVDSVISGCKYLVSTQQRVQEKPGRLNPVINIDDISIKAMMLGVLAFVVLSSIAFLIYYHYSHKPEDDI